MSRSEPKQNLSGHVCFDVPQTRFFQEVHNKVHKLELKWRAGQVPERKDRNPLNAEKSPRRNESFEYRPPPAVPQQEKWIYPESDWGLMAKFRSQKQIYDDINAKEALYQEQVDKVASIREANQRMIKAEFDRQKSLYDVAKKKQEEADKQRFNAIMSVDLGNGGSHSGGMQKSHGPDELDLALEKDARAAAAAQAERIRKKKDHSSLLTLIKESTPPADFYHTKITTFKTIGDKHPEVLAEWRAKRAAEFVSKNPHALEVPKTRELSATSFRPGGIGKTGIYAFTDTVKPAKTKSTTALKPIDPSLLDINSLKQQLKETEGQMQRQQLKISLNTKPPKRYEVPKNEKVPVSTKQRRGSR